MQVQFVTTITTVIDLTSGATVDEARREIFDRFFTSIEENDPVQDVKDAHSDAVVFDQIVGISVTHSFGEL